MTRAPQPTGKTPSNQSWRAAAGGRRLREMLGNAGRGSPARTAACGTVKKWFIPFTVVLNDINDLASLCLNFSIIIPIRVAKHRAELEPCIDGKSNDINDLASIRPRPEGQWRMKACSGTGGPAHARNAGKCWARPGADCGVRDCEEVISFTVRSKDIKDLARYCYNYSISVPISVVRYHAEPEPCIVSNSSNVKDLASIGRTPRDSGNRKGVPGPGPPP